MDYDQKVLDEGIRIIEEDEINQQQSSINQRDALKIKRSTPKLVRQLKRLLKINKGGFVSEYDLELGAKGGSQARRSK